MNLAKKITRIFILIFFAAFLFSCGEGCVEYDEFDVEALTIESKPEKDGITGNYDHAKGGQIAEWHKTGLKSNGDKFIIQIRGAFIPWDGGVATNSGLASIERCDFCAKKSSPSSPNCLCYEHTKDGISYTGDRTDPTSFPTPEKGIGGELATDDCESIDNQNDPNKCSCTSVASFGKALDNNTYHFPLNYANKDGTSKIPDKQSACKYDRGMGLYMGLFGSRGVQYPNRVYHLFSTYKICDIFLDSKKECRASDGTDMTSYIYTSPNDRIFIKDDNNYNNGTDTNTFDDTYHSANENIKFKIFDSYYDDNFGQYRILILRGVGGDDVDEDGLLEFLVSLVEDTMLGEIDSSGDRQGGIIQFMYQSIVQDTNFIRVVQISLSLYIALFGAAHLFGLTEWSKKEVMGRILKIGLIIFFTSPSSWYFYNQIIVSFFKDSMDYVVNMMMSLSDSNIDPTSMTITSQMERANDASNATRFSYIDSIIKKLFSIATAKKIFGLFFGSYYGILLIPVTYFVILYFIYVMLWAAVHYTINIMKIIFVLALGPIFICFTLFSHTASMFKSWLGYLGGRSIEIIMLFSVLYSFITLIDKNFNNLLYFRTCVENQRLGILTFKILRSGISERSLLQWMIMYVTIAGLTFILNLIIDKISDVSSALFSVEIGGTKTRSDGSEDNGSQVASHGSGAAGIMSAVKGAAIAAASGAFSTAGYLGGKGMKVGRMAMRVSGASQALGNMFSSFPISSPGTMYNNYNIDSAISRGREEAASKGLTGKEADSYARQTANNILQNQMLPKNLNYAPLSKSMPNALAMTGLDSRAIQARFEQKMVQQPLKDFLKAESQKLKNQDPDKIPLGKDMRNQLRTNAMAWAEKNLVGGSAAVEKYLGKEGRDAGKAGGSAFAVAARDINNVLKSSAELSTAEAAKSFAGNPSLQNKFLQHLQERDFKRNLRNSEAQSPIAPLPKAKTNLGKTVNAMRTAVDVTANVIGKRAPNLASRALDGVLRTEARNPKMAQQSFLRNVRNQETWNSESTKKNALVLNPLNRSNTLDRSMNMFGFSNSSLTQRTDEARRKALVGLLKSEAKLEIATPKTDLKKDKRAADKKNEKDAKRSKFLQSELRKIVKKNVEKDLAQIKKLEKIENGGPIKKFLKKNSWYRNLDENLSEAKERIKKISLDITVDKTGTKITGAEGKTIFETAIELDCLQRKSGFEGKNLKLVLKALEADSEINADKLEKAIASATNPEDLYKAEKEAQDFAKLRTGLFSSEIQIKNFNPLEDPSFKGTDVQQAMRDLEESLMYKRTSKETDDEYREKDEEDDENVNLVKTEIQRRSDHINESLLEKKLEVLRTVDKKIELEMKDHEKKYDVEITEAKTTTRLEAIKGAVSEFIEKTMRREFGGSISDISKKDPDFDLGHADKILLGYPDKDGKIDKSVQINSIKTLLKQAEVKLITQTIDKKMKEFEFSQLEKLKAAGAAINDGDITKLRQEIIELEKQVSQSQNQVDRVKENIDNLEKK
jgi:hypothetical protein